MHPFLKSLLPALAFGLLLTSAAIAQTEPPRQITVTGEGMVAVTPDLAYVNLGVSQDADTANEALTGMSLAMEAVLARLAAAGIEPADVQTGQLTLDPRYDYNTYDGAPKMLGYTATTTVDVRVRDLAKLGGVLDAVVEDGANRLGGVRFDVADRGPVMEAARRAAVADAMARAELFADAAGVGLGPLVTLNEVNNFSAPMPMAAARFEMAADAGSVPVAGGEVSLQATVTMVYAIAP